jgi:hypothetical protein
VVERYDLSAAGGSLVWQLLGLGAADVAAVLADKGALVDSSTKLAAMAAAGVCMGKPSRAECVCEYVAAHAIAAACLRSTP